MCVGCISVAAFMLNALTGKSALDGPAMMMIMCGCVFGMFWYSSSMLDGHLHIHSPVSTMLYAASCVGQHGCAACHVVWITPHPLISTTTSMHPTNASHTSPAADDVHLTRPSSGPRSSPMLAVCSHASFHRAATLAGTCVTVPSCCVRACLLCDCASWVP